MGYTKQEKAQIERNIKETLNSLPPGKVVDEKYGTISDSIEKARTESDRNERNIGQTACGKTPG